MGRRVVHIPVEISNEAARFLREELLLNPDTWAQGEIDYALRRLRVLQKRREREAVRDA